MNYNLEDTWKYCLRMWRWVAWMWFFWHVLLRRNMDVGDLKIRWAKKKGFINEFRSTECFFCDYSYQHGHGCGNCPGRLADVKFHCAVYKYKYDIHPIRFYFEIRRLNKIRRKAS